ncbi:MAG: ribosome assembly cofactor RimP [Spirochaetaceae bacterium]|jgi:ribosome maturation factor RimP|nr:ribosome assembly cofactor RimP [Spirochaetaceae bacterium]
MESHLKAMQFSQKENEPLYQELEQVVKGLGMALVELTVAKSKGGAKIRAVITPADAKLNAGLLECSRVHRAVMPRIELAFPQENVSVEISSPGINRQLKNAGEFRHFTGKKIACYRTDISDWCTGLLESAGEHKITIRENEKMTELKYSIIGKAKLAGEI